MKKKIIKYVAISLAIGMELLPAIALAQGSLPQITLDKDTLTTVFDNIKEWVAEAIFILGILMVLYAAFLYMTSAGDDTKIDKAKKTFIYGIVGIIIALLAYGIWDAVESFLEG